MEELGYDELISKLTNRFRGTIQNEDEELINGFRNYLNLAIKSIEEMDDKFINKDKESIKSFVENVAEELINSDLLTKQKQLITDEDFEMLKQKSNEIFTDARKVLSGEAITANYNTAERIDEIQSLLKSVKNFNREQAEQLVSETILDLQYISNPKMEIYSLRLGAMKRYQIQEEQNKKIESEGEER